MEKKKGFGVIGLTFRLFSLFIVLALCLCLTGCGKQFARIEENQQALQSMIKDNTEYITELSLNMQHSRDVLEAQIEMVRNETLTVGTNVNAVGDQQQQLYEKTQDINRLTTEQTIAVIEENIAVLKAEMEEMQNGIIQVASNVSAVSHEQARLYETIEARNQELNQKITVINERQSVLQAGIENAMNETVKVASDIATLGEEQQNLHITTQENIQQVANDVVVMQNKQNMLQAGIENAVNETVKVASDLAALDDKQQNLHITTQKNIQQVAKDVVVIQNSQTRLQAGIQEVQKSTDEVEVALANADQKQMELREIAHNNNLLLNETIETARQNQEQLQAKIANLQIEASQTAANISVVNNEQKSLQEIVQNNNQQLIDKVVEVQQNQQQWQEAFHQIQERIQEVTSNIGVLDNNLSQLHNVLQNNIGDIQAALNVTNQEQQEFQEKMQSELFALADTVGVIKQSQADLQKQIEEVRFSAEGINTYVPTVFKELREDIANNINKEDDEIITD